MARILGLVTLGFGALFALGLLFITPKYLVEWMILTALLVVVVGMPLSYRLTMRRLRRPRPDQPRLLLFDDRVLIERRGKPDWVLPRDDTLSVTARWFQGIAGDRIFVGAGKVSYGRGYTAVISVLLRSPAGEVVLIAGGDISPIYGEDWATRDAELFVGWPEPPRVRLWPADLVAVGQALAARVGGDTDAGRTA